MVALNLWTTLTQNTTPNTTAALRTTSPASVNTLTVTGIPAGGTGVYEMRGLGQAGVLTGSTGTTPISPGTNQRGHLLPLDLLEGWTMPGGSMTPIVAVSASATGLTVKYWVRFYRRTSAGVYTLIFSSSEAASSALTTTVTARTLPTATGVVMNFTTGDRFYVDIWADITANTAGAAVDLRLQTGGNGAPQTLFQTTGYTSAPAYRRVGSRSY